MAYQTELLPLLKFHLRRCHFLKCVYFDFNDKLGRLEKSKSARLRKICNIQVVMSILYCFVQFLNLCFRSYGMSDKLQGIVFFLLVLIATVVRWNQASESNQAIQVINSFLHFERVGLTDTIPSRITKSRIVKTTQAFI
ncbi:hypothetical protein Fcan01_00719 [Folsomia candida]|uniref:Uncharacterized protein n=1 Tax=Folsomia candida TaxID=158441 RepID=A0A226EZE9_FOLCA|nr:hypothetical protein Fcan01_00719 [Folsomia candida]